MSEVTEQSIELSVINPESTNVEKTIVEENSTEYNYEQLPQTSIQSDDESETEPNDESERKPEDESENEPEDESENESESETEPDNKSETEPDNKSETEPNNDSDNESERESEGESDNESDNESDDEPGIESSFEPVSAIEITAEPPFDAKKMRKLFTTIGCDGNLYSVLQKDGQKLWMKLDTDISCGYRIQYFDRRLPTESELTEDVFNKLMGGVLLYKPNMFGSCQYNSIYTSFLFFAILARHNISASKVYFKCTDLKRGDLSELKLYLVKRNLENLLDENNSTGLTYDDLVSVDQTKEYLEEFMEKIENDKISFKTIEDKTYFKKELNTCIKFLYFSEEILDQYFVAMREQSYDLWSAIPKIFAKVFPSSNVTSPKFEVEGSPKLLNHYNWVKNYELGYKVYLMWSQGLIKDLNTLNHFDT
jgi:hypothetical protein